MEASARGDRSHGRPEPTTGLESRPADWFLLGDTRRPMPSLVFVLPLMLAYELAVLCQGGSTAGALRTGADAWLRQVLGSAGLTDQWFLPCSWS